MSRTIETNKTAPTTGQVEAPSVDLKDASMTPEASSSASRLQFYREYREAVRELKEGNPTRFLAFQEEPRIKPTPESLRAPTGMRSSIEQASIEAKSMEPAKTLADAHNAFTSLVSSIKGLTTALASFLS